MNTVIDILYGSFEEQTDDLTQELNRLVVNIENIRRTHNEAIQNAINNFLGSAQIEELNAYYKEIVKFLSKDLCRQLSSTKVSPLIKSQKLLMFIAICHECFIETSMNYFLGYSEAVLRPIYKSYAEQIKKLREIQ